MQHKQIKSTRFPLLSAKLFQINKLVSRSGKPYDAHMTNVAFGSAVFCRGHCAGSYSSS